MNNQQGLLDRHTFQPVFTYLFFCGVAVLLSIPPAQDVQHFGVATFSEIPIYFYVHILCLGILGLNFGAVYATQLPSRKASLRFLATQILLAQCLALPYLLLERGVYPAKMWELVLIVLYTSLIGFLCAFFGYWIERPARGRTAQAFTVKYLMLCIYYFAPLAFLPIISPLGSVRMLLDASEAHNSLYAFVLPAGFLGAMVVLLRRESRGGKRV
jgi:hypothetical protein